MVLEDLEGGASCVVPDRGARSGTGPVAALPLDSADPARDGAFWAGITGWAAVDGEVGERLLDLGATSLSAPGELPWLVFADPSGNELCVLG